LPRDRRGAAGATRSAELGRVHRGAAAHDGEEGGEDPRAPHHPEARDEEQREEEARAIGAGRVAWTAGASCDPSGRFYEIGTARALLG